MTPESIARRRAYRREYERTHREELNAKARARHARNPSIALAANRRWRESHPGAQFDGHLRRRYGITLENYHAMLDAQDGKCAICLGTKPGGRTEMFCVDHDHTSGAVRGLLCQSCNKGLTTYEMHPEATAAYLARYRRP